jgi:addiction module HigA family antidote
MRMYNPPHPGAILRELWIEPMNVSITKIAAHLDVSRKALSELLNEHTAMSTDMALRLQLAFGKSARSWLAHQTDYDLWQKQASLETLGVQAFPMESVDEDALEAV